MEGPAFSSGIKGHPQSTRRSHGTFMPGSVTFLLLANMLVGSAMALRRKPPPHVGVANLTTNATTSPAPPSVSASPLPSQNWGSIVSDDSGMQLAATTTGYGTNSIYTSSDGGATFAPSGTAFTIGSLQPLAASRDGARLAFANFLGCSIGRSTDAGKTWTSSRVCPTAAAAGGTISPSPLLTGVACSANGSQLYVLSLKGPMFASRDGGTTFARLPGLPASPLSQQSFGPIAVSHDGVRIAAIVKTWTTDNSTDLFTWSSGLYASKDGGVTFTLAPGTAISCTTSASSCPSEWTSIAGSKDGTRIVAAASGGALFTSADYGASYEARQISSPSSTTGTQQQVQQPWSAVASSANGTRLAAAARDGHIFTSADSGASWLLRANLMAQQWNSIASSDDGGRLAAVATGGDVFTSDNGGAAWRMGALCPLCQPQKPQSGLLG